VPSLVERRYSHPSVLLVVALWHDRSDGSIILLFRITFQISRAKGHRQVSMSLFHLIPQCRKSFSDLREGSLSGDLVLFCLLRIVDQNKTKGRSSFPTITS